MLHRGADVAMQHANASEYAGRLSRFCMSLEVLWKGFMFSGRVTSGIPPELVWVWLVGDLPLTVLRFLLVWGEV